MISLKLRRGDELPTPCLSRMAFSSFRVDSRTTFSSSSSLRDSAVLLLGTFRNEGEWISILSKVLPMLWMPNNQSSTFKLARGHKDLPFTFFTGTFTKVHVIETTKKFSALGSLFHPSTTIPTSSLLFRHCS